MGWHEERSIITHIENQKQWIALKQLWDINCYKLKTVGLLYFILWFMCFYHKVTVRPCWVMLDPDSLPAWSFSVFKISVFRWNQASFPQSRYCHLTSPASLILLSLKCQSFFCRHAIPCFSSYGQCPIFFPVLWKIDSKIISQMLFLWFWWIA